MLGTGCDGFAEVGAGCGGTTDVETGCSKATDSRLGDINVEGLVILVGGCVDLVGIGTTVCGSFQNDI